MDQSQMTPASGGEGLRGCDNDDRKTGLPQRMEGQLPTA